MRHRVSCPGCGKRFIASDNRTKCYRCGRRFNKWASLVVQ